MRKALFADNGRWTEIDFQSIKKDMVIKLFEEDGTPVKYGDCDQFKCAGDSYKTEKAWTVMVEKWKQSKN